MFKKVILLGAGGLLVLGLLFGRNLVPYAGTAIGKAQAWADSQVDTGYKIETARNLLKNVDEQIEPMVYDIAKQKVLVKNLAKRIDSSSDALVKAEMHILKLRNHLDTEQVSYVSTSGRKYTNQKVKENLTREFRRYKLSEQKLEVLKATLTSRTDSLKAAQENLEATHSRRTDLAAQIDSLEAEMKLLAARKTSCESLQFDNGNLSQIEKLCEEIQLRNDTDATMLDIVPSMADDFPMEDDTEDGDIVEAVNAHFSIGNDDLVSN